MKVRELIAELSNEDGDAEVRVAVQPSYPMEASFIGVVPADAVAQDSDDECERTGCYDARSDHPGNGACIARDVGLLDDDTPCLCTEWQYDADKNASAVWLAVGDNIGYSATREMFASARRGW